MFKVLLKSLLLLLIPSAVYAGIFTAVPTDKAVHLLGYIFGPNVGGLSLVGDPNPTLLRMFEIFNAMILSIGVVIVSYIAIVSTLNTAQEGQAMGKKWSSLWIPLRAALGMLCIVPTPATGYSLVQVIVMWCILQGIGAADTIWNTILRDLGNGVSVMSAIQVDKQPNTTIYEILERDGVILTENLLRSAVCNAALQRISNDTVQNHLGYESAGDTLTKELGALVRFYTRGGSIPTVDRKTMRANGSINIGITNDDEYHAVCGKYHITAEVDRNEWPEPSLVTEDEMVKAVKEIYMQKRAAIQLMYSNLKPLADLIVDGKVGPRNQNNELALSYDQPPWHSGYKDLAVKTYINILGSLVKPQPNESLQSIVREGMDHGWISAGSFYFNLNKASRVGYFRDVQTPPIAENVPKCDEELRCNGHIEKNDHLLNERLWRLLESDHEINFLGNRLWDAKMHLAFDNNSIGFDEVLNLDTKDYSEQSPLHRIQTDAAYLLNELMANQHADPLIAQGKFGIDLMLSSERAWLQQHNKLQITLNRIEQNKTSITQEILEQINRLNQAGSLSLTIYGVVWVLGAMLAIYVPLIPYMMFTVGIVGWLLMVVEAIVAAPMMALGFVVPSGDELGKTVQGIMLLLNIVLRPVLMLFGFILATRLYQAVIKLVNFGIVSNYSYLQTGESLFAWVAVLSLYAGLITILANKCFTLIYGLPDKVMRWMGSAPEHTDASQELYQAKNSMSRGADMVNKISTGMAERNAGHLQSRLNQLRPPDSMVGS